MKTNVLAILAALPVWACSADSYQRVARPPLDVDISSPAVTRIYVLRMPQAIGAIRAVRVVETGREVGRIGQDSYLCWERAPGRTVGELEYEGPMLDTSAPGVVDFDCQAGHVYYYGITIDPAWKKPVVRMLSREDALEILRDCKPAPPH